MSDQPGVCPNEYEISQASELPDVPQWAQQQDHYKNAHWGLGIDHDANEGRVG